MGIIAQGTITLTSVNDAFSVSLSPSSCVINADYNGKNPQLTYAYSDIKVIRGEFEVPFDKPVILDKPESCEVGLVQLDATTWRINITSLPSDLQNGKISLKISVGKEFLTTTSFAFTVIRETSMLDWILDWNGSYTEIAGKWVITPKIFAGTKSADNKLTGVYLGPAFDNNESTGLYGYKNDEIIFQITETGGVIGGWQINNGGIQTSDGCLKILSEGTISSSQQGVVAWQLKSDGSASFAGDKVRFFADGNAEYEGKITAKSGQIGGWNIGAHSIYNQAILIDSTAHFIGIRKENLSYLSEPSYSSFYTDIQVSGGIAIFSKNKTSYGVECWSPSSNGGADQTCRKVFSLGNQNMIAGWNFDNQAIYIGVKNNTARQNTSLPGYITIGSNGLRGYCWYIDSDGEISFVDGLLKFDRNGGTISGWTLGIEKFTTDNVALVSADGYTGLYLANSVLPESYFNYHQHIDATGGIILSTNDSGAQLLARDISGELLFQLTGVESYIGGWKFNSRSLYVGASPTPITEYAKKGCITLSPQGLIGFKFSLLASGSGSLAGGKIFWTDDGDITFDNSVKISWSQVTDTDSVMTKTTYFDANGIFTGQVNADKITTGTLSAERIDADALLSNKEKWALFQDGSGFLASRNISWGPNGDLNVCGTITASSGRVAGFQIDGDSLTNVGFDNDACIIFRNDHVNVFGAMGGNTLPASSGLRAVARFENNDTTAKWASRNIALYLSAQNGTYNHAFMGYGNGTLNGWIGGYRFDRFTLTEENIIYSDYVNLNKNNRWICKSLVRGSGIALPRLNEVQDALSVAKTTPFCIDLMILSDIGSSNFHAYGRTDRADSSGKQPWNTEQYPTFVDQNGRRLERLELSAGDCLHVLLIYDPTEEQELSNYPCRYTARIINKET